MIDSKFVRSQFPAFSDPSLEGWAFFENAGGSYACKQVIQRLTDYYHKTKVQPYAPYPASTQAGERMDESYSRLANYLNVDAKDIHFGPSTSQNSYVLAQAFRQGWKEGDEIIVTNQDHEANSGVWRQLVDAGMVIREWKIDPETGSLDINDLDGLITDKTRLLTFPHCSNVVGEINPVTEICTKAKAADVMTVVDGVSYAGHGLPDVNALGADIYLFSLYKVYGPHQGAMTVRKATAELLGNQGHFFNAGVIHKQFNPAGPDHAQVAACNGVSEYFDALYEHHFGKPDSNHQRAVAVANLIHQAEQARIPAILDFLNNRKNVRLIGPKTAENRAPTIAITAKNQNPHELCEALAKDGIMAGSGHFYAYRAVEALGESTDLGVLRLSFVHYTTDDEVQQLLTTLDKVLD